MVIPEDCSELATRLLACSTDALFLFSISVFRRKPPAMPMFFMPALRSVAESDSSLITGNSPLLLPLADVDCSSPCCWREYDDNGGESNANNKRQHAENPPVAAGKTKISDKE